MRKLALFFLLLCTALPCAAQTGIRFGDGQPIWSAATAPSKNIQIVSNATIAFCDAPASAVPCTNYATTYTDATLGTTCPSVSQLVLAGTTACVGTTDLQGNWGVWLNCAVTTQYAYTVTVGANSYGPYPVTPCGSGSSGPPGPPGAGGAAWDSMHSYNLGDTATFQGIVFSSLVGSNVGNSPTDQTSWIPSYPSLLSVTAYGARAVPMNTGGVYQAASCQASSTSVTLGSAGYWAFTGDGIALFGCGATNTLSTPSAPTLAATLEEGPTNTGFHVYTPAETCTSCTTYTVKIIGLDAEDGYTAASTAATVSADSTLGTKSAVVTAATRSGNTTTYTTATATTIVQYAWVHIEGANPGDFDGWYNVSNVVDSTHFQTTAGMDTGYGAAASATFTSGQVAYKAAIHISWMHVDAQVKTCAYITSSSIVTPIIKCSKLNDVASHNIEDFIDFDGPTDDGNFTPPFWMPTTAPSSASNDVLATTITAGAGTTSITVADAASTTTSSSPAEFDNSKAIEAACMAAAYTRATLYFPPTDPYGFSAAFNIAAPTTCYGAIVIRRSGTIYLDDTFTPTYPVIWRDSLEGSGVESGQFPLGGATCQGSVQVGRAFPGIHLPYTASGSLFDGMCMTGGLFGTSNGNLLMLADGQYGTEWEHSQFLTDFGTKADDYSSIGLDIRGGTNDGGNAYDIKMTDIEAEGGPGNSGPYDNTSWTPIISEYGVLQGTTIDRISLTGRGLFSQSSYGNWLTLNNAHVQGPIQPLLTLGFPSGGVNRVEINFPNIDSSAEPALAVQLAAPDTYVSFDEVSIGAQNASGQVTPDFTGGPVNSIVVSGYSGVLGQDIPVINNLPLGNSGSSGISGGTINEFALFGSATTITGAVGSSGTGNVCRVTNCTLITPALGTPSAINLTNASGFPTLNQNTTGTAASAAKWTTARNLAGNSVDGSANVNFSNKFLVQGTADSGLTGAQFLGALPTGLMKVTTTTGVVSNGAAADVYGLWSGTCDSSHFLRGDGACAQAFVPQSQTTLTDAATVSFNAGSLPNPWAKVTLGGNRTLAVTNMVTGGSYLLNIVQDGTGSRTLTLGTGGTGGCAAWYVSGGGGGAISLTATAGATDLLGWKFDGTSCFAVLNNNFN